MERRVLIVESQNDFALSMATVLKSAGYQTAMAATAADAQREMEKRRPDLVVRPGRAAGSVRLHPVRADQEGQVGAEPPGAAAVLGHGRGGAEPAPPDAGCRGRLPRHPLRDGRARLHERRASCLPEEDAGQPALLGRRTSAPCLRPLKPARPPPPAARPSCPSASAAAPSPRRTARFLDRAFQSIADRKAELLAESRQLKRPPPRRDLMGTPEGKVQLLRDELKVARGADRPHLGDLERPRARAALGRGPPPREGRGAAGPEDAGGRPAAALQRGPAGHAPEGA